MRLLLIEDDAPMARQVQTALEAAGHVVVWADNGTDGGFRGREESFDLVILDLGLPDKSGLEVLREWRGQGIKVPVLILTARDTWQERVEGLRAGADDYVCKPFYMEELLARVEVLIRRHYDRADNHLEWNGVVLHTDTQSLSLPAGESHSLTAAEFRILHALMANPARVVSKSVLAEQVWQDDDIRDSNVIEVYINRLRKILGKDFIVTRRGQGYQLGQG